ncbi:preprotein translocase subunit SecG [Duganella sp. Root1480D1]|uniref:preprotein translocase subunit SecG n=1 Tax=Duganella sp. Root1480D1 TaxID=1736471 RepID=UPI00070D3B65|nr:preprotein translocase subunit SecG [Duganella sp. Root1480D1]KQZ45008.1 preprotein translocase subunit SecG [Duganella sp. Root1480D1]
MNSLFNLVIVVQVLSAIAIVGLVLLQHGKGADMGAAFGSGASGSLFGASGSSNFMSKSTAVAAAIFFAATLGLSVLASKGNVSVGAGVMDNVKAPVTAPAPVGGAAAIPSAAPAPAAPAAATPAPVEAPAASAPAAPAPAAATPAASPAK